MEKGVETLNTAPSRITYWIIILLFHQSFVNGSEIHTLTKK